MLLALDDTDGPDGGCTTHVAAEIADRLGADHLAGRPRLVRLDPSTPWKTRGNGAVVLPLADHLDPDRVLDLAYEIVEDRARVAEGKGAGVLVLDAPPEKDWYRRGVRRQVPLEAVQAAAAGERAATLGTGRGLVGAWCAAAWRPSATATFERIAYRAPQRWGTERRVDPESLRAVEARFEETFDCVDPVDGHPAMVPRTPCPVLYGLRATRPDRLEAAQQAIESEPARAAVTFETNHATDDHLAPEDLEPVTVTGTPETLEGGHVRVPAETDEGRELALMAFEPTGQLRAPVRELREGDRALPVGSREGDAVHLEKILVHPAERPAATPCPRCGGQMASQGRGQPRRCPRCSIRRPSRTVHPDPAWHEARVSARRHLARPLALGLAPHVAEAATMLDDAISPPASREEPADVAPQRL